MENKQYRPRRGPMGRSMRGGEKPKDLVGIWKKLLGYCKKYTAFFIIAVICASVGTVCTLVGPDKLSDMTDEITSGIKPDTDELEKITTAVSDNISDNMQKVLGKIAANMSDPQNMKPEIKINGSDISLEDQKEALKLIRGMDKNNSDAAQNIINKLPHLPPAQNPAGDNSLHRSSHKPFRQSDHLYPTENKDHLQNLPTH